MGAIPVPILGAGISAIGGIIDSVAQSEANRKNRKWSEMMAQRQREWGLADFHMQNEYNSPAAQMSRLKAAGLNPNLVYGTGAATQQAQPVRSSNVPQGTNKSIAPGTGIQNSIASYIQLKSMDADIDLKKTQQMVNLIETVLKRNQGENVAADTATKKFDLGLKTDLRDTSISAAQAQLQKTLAETRFTLDANERANALQSPTITKLIAETAKIAMDNSKTVEEKKEIQAKVRLLLSNKKLVDVETELKQEDLKLKKQGIQPHDKPVMRWLQRIFQRDTKAEKVWEFAPHSGMH